MVGRFIEIVAIAALMAGFSGQAVADPQNLKFHLRDFAAQPHWFRPAREGILGPRSGGAWFQLSADGLAYFEKNFDKAGVEPRFFGRDFEKMIVDEAVTGKNGKIDTFLVFLGRLSKMDPKQFREQIDFRYEDEVMSFFTMTDAEYRAEYLNTPIARHLGFDSKTQRWQPKSRFWDPYGREFDLTNEYLKQLQKAIGTLHDRLEEQRNARVQAINKENPNGASLVIRGSPQTETQDGIHEKVVKAFIDAGLMTKLTNAIEEMIYKKLQDVNLRSGNLWGSNTPLLNPSFSIDPRPPFLAEAAVPFSFNRLTQEFSFSRQVRIPLGLNEVVASGPKPPGQELLLGLTINGSLRVRVGLNERKPKAGENLLADLSLMIEVENFEASIDSAYVVSEVDGKSVSVPWKEAQDLMLRFSTHDGAPLRVKIPQIRISAPRGSERYRIQVSPSDVETNFADLQISGYENRATGEVYDSLKQIFIRNPKWFLTPLRSVISEPLIEAQLQAEAKKLRENFGTDPVDDYAVINTKADGKLLFFSKWLFSEYGLSKEAYQAKSDDIRKQYFEMFKRMVLAGDGSYDLFGRVRVNMKGGLTVERIPPSDDVRNPKRLDLGGFRFVKREPDGFELEFSEVLLRPTGADKSVLSGDDKVTVVFRPKSGKTLEIQDVTRLYIEDGQLFVNYTKGDVNSNLAKDAYIAEVRVKNKNSTMEFRPDKDGKFDLDSNLRQPETMVQQLRRHFSETPHGIQFVQQIRGAIVREVNLLKADPIAIKSISARNQADHFKAKLNLDSKVQIAGQEMTFLNEKEGPADSQARRTIDGVERSGKEYLGTVRYRVELDSSRLAIGLSDVDYSGEGIFMVQKRPNVGIERLNKWLQIDIGVVKRIDLKAQKADFVIASNDGKNFYFTVDAKIYHDSKTGAIELLDDRNSIRGNLLQVNRLTVEDFKMEGLSLFGLRVPNALKAPIVEKVLKAVNREKGVIAMRIVESLKKDLDKELKRIGTEATRVSEGVDQGILAVKKMLEEGPQRLAGITRDAIYQAKEARIKGVRAPDEPPLKEEALVVELNRKLNGVFDEVTRSESKLGENDLMTFMSVVSGLLERSLPEVNGRYYRSWGEAVLLRALYEEREGPAKRPGENAPFMDTYIRRFTVPIVLATIFSDVLIKDLKGGARADAIRDILMKEPLFKRLGVLKIEDLVAKLDSGLELARPGAAPAGTIEGTVNGQIQSFLRDSVPGFFFDEDYIEKVAREESEEAARRAKRAIMGSADLRFDRMTFVNGCPVFVWRSGGNVIESNSIYDLLLNSGEARGNAGSDVEVIVPQASVESTLDYVFKEISKEGVPYLFVKGQKDIKDKLGLTLSDDVVVNEAKFSKDGKLTVKLYIYQRSTGFSQLLHLFPHIALAAGYLFYKSLPGRVERFGEGMTAGIDQTWAFRSEVAFGLSDFHVELKEGKDKQGRPVEEMVVRVGSFAAETPTSRAHIGNAFSAFVAKMIADVLNSNKKKEEILAQLREMLKVSADRDVVKAIFENLEPEYDRGSNSYRMGMKFTKDMFSRLAKIDPGKIEGIADGLSKPDGGNSGSQPPAVGRSLNRFLDGMAQPGSQ